MRLTPARSMRTPTSAARACVRLCLGSWPN